MSTSFGQSTLTLGPPTPGRTPVTNTATPYEYPFTVLPCGTITYVPVVHIITTTITIIDATHTLLGPAGPMRVESPQHLGPFPWSPKP